MNNLQQVLSHFLNDESGQDIVEYALVAALVALATIAGVGRVGSAVALYLPASAPGSPALSDSTDHPAFAGQSPACDRGQRR